MKFTRSAAIVLVLCAFSAFAKDKNEGKLTLQNSTAVGSTNLKPGEYKIAFDDVGPSVEVRFLQGKTVVATANASVMENASRQTGVAVTTAEAGKTRIIKQIDFGKRTLTFVSGEGAVQGQ